MNTIQPPNNQHQTIIIPTLTLGMTALEKSLISNINECDKLSTAYLQAKGCEA